LRSPRPAENASTVFKDWAIARFSITSLLDRLPLDRRRNHAAYRLPGVAPSDSSGVSALVASSSTLSFGNVQKSKSSDLSETLTNAGGAALTISEATVSGTGFSVSGLTLPVTLSSKQSVTFTVTFAPASTGSASGTLAVLSTANDSTLNIALSGTETAQGQLSVSPASLSFGNVVVGANRSLTAHSGSDRIASDGFCGRH